MDKLIKLNRWLLFELIVTIASLLLLFFIGVDNLSEMGDEMGYTWLGGMFLLILRIFFLGSAWFSLLPDNDDPDLVTRSKFEPKVFKPADDEE